MIVPVLTSAGTLDGSIASARLQLASAPSTLPFAQCAHASSMAFVTARALGVALAADMRERRFDPEQLRAPRGDDLRQRFLRRKVRKEHR